MAHNKSTRNLDGVESIIKSLEYEKPMVSNTKNLNKFIEHLKEKSQIIIFIFTNIKKSGS